MIPKSQVYLVLAYMRPKTLASKCHENFGIFSQYKMFERNYYIVTTSK